MECKYTKVRSSDGPTASEHLREQVLLDHLAPDVADQDVRFLDAGSDGTGDDHAE